MGPLTGPKQERREPIDLASAGIVGSAMLLLRSWRTIVVAGVGCGVLGLAAALVMHPVYEATCTFISSSQVSGDSGAGGLNSLSSAAVRLGVDLKGGAGDLSPLYPWMLENRVIGRHVLETPLADRRGNEVRLLEYLAPSQPDTGRRFDRALTKLHRKVLNYSFDRKSGVTRVTAALDDPVLAAATANAFVSSLDAYNQGVMSDKASSLAGFLEERLRDFEQQIGREERALRDFRTANRGFAQSPSLALEEARLTRNLELAQQLYLNLRLQFEMTRMEEFKRLPRLTIIDRAHPPYRRTSPRVFALVALAGVLGGALGLAWVIGVNQWRLYQSQPPGGSSANPRPVVATRDERE